mmetsp:Transcript_13089/g.19294  ORF Transcript_13089/g.19294 Transcript_13089/m.19294 type:complete len:275 (-) Transcript_13089:715-1539(-)|eukprot:CAMPEP_0194037110 /NCGR_PEP_ID=MMETSP0009_2-20130614/9454_1 /TAXON_ID=210454 /ORGANISM="Grammatophora oceanica, Strain CCMP 410" /LENGTH=274 /DNA_ID=CAMNT_0038679137 /DNA_START=99 /DNA_END=923 /DNA_ORIENTATION=-
MNEYWQQLAPAGGGGQRAAAAGASPEAAQSGAARAGSKRKQQQLRTDIPPDPSREALARMSRTEKKAHREKKRRNQVNKGIEDLTALLKEIDPEITGADGTEEDFSMNRVDLIQKTVVVLRKLHKDYLENKETVQAIRDKLSDKQEDEAKEEKGDQKEEETKPPSLKPAPSAPSDSSLGGGEKQEDQSPPEEEKQVVLVVPYLTPVLESLPSPYPRQQPWRTGDARPRPPPRGPPPPTPRQPAQAPHQAGRQLYYNYDHPPTSHQSTLRTSASI